MNAMLPKSPQDHVTPASSAQPTADPLSPPSPWARSAAGANTFDHGAGTVLPTIYERTTAAAIAHEAVNLGQGFPDREGPEWLRQAAAQALTDPAVGPSNQYAPGLGLPVLREAVAEDHLRRTGISLDPSAEVMITTGATEAIAASILAFASPGSQVLTFEPHYDSYGSMTALAGAELVGVPLSGPEFHPDMDALEAAVTERTSMLLLNTPHNPTGTVFTEQELRRAVGIARRHGLVIMCDEVYEQLVLEADQQHRSILSIPGAAEVAVAIGSAGKSFSLTGWKIGWLCGSAELVNRIRGVKQFLTFSSGPGFQWAVAQGLQDDRGFFAENAASLAAARDLLHSGLHSAGLRPNRAASGYFLLADISEATDLDDVAFCRLLAEEVGVAAIPVSSLIIQHRSDQRSADAPDPLRRLVRFAFCKRLSSLEEGIDRMVSRLPKVL